MQKEIIELSRLESQMLMRISMEMSLNQLKDLISDSIQHGPVISISGRLHRFEQMVIPPICWEAMKEFVDWGAGIISHHPDNQSCYLLADSAHAERVLRLIAKLLDSDSGQSEKQAKLDSPISLPTIKPQRKHEELSDMGR